MDRSGREGFALLLRGLRESRSLTQEELATRAGLTVKAVGALERGERLRPYPHTVRALADALDLDEHERASLVGSVPRRVSAPHQDLPEDAGAEDGVPNPALAVPATRLIGRDDDVARVAGLFHDGHRLVTLTGPGGVGKTRLALEVLQRHGSALTDRQAFVDLAAVRDPGLVLPRIAARLDVPETGGRSAPSLAPFLAGRRLLVALDNLEQLLESGAALAELVAVCPDLLLLVTSRAPLRVRAEHEVRLEPLALPLGDDPDEVAGSPAVSMFVDRAAAAGSPVDLTAEDAATVAALCRRLDGLPLALELAAARSRLLTPAALLARLDERSHDPGPRDLPDRQRTMTTTLDWSRELLDPAQRTLFERLAVFCGGFSLAAVPAVADAGQDVMADLAALVDHSLVVRTPSTGDEPRFRLLEPVRQYAALRLQESGAAATTADRHAQLIHELAVASRARLVSSSVIPALDALEEDHADLRAGFLRLVETGRPDRQPRSAGAPGSTTPSEGTPAKAPAGSRRSRRIASEPPGRRTPRRPRPVCPSSEAT